MNKFNVFFVVLSVLFLVSACNSDNKTNTKSSETSQIISANGGKISSDDQRLTLDIPAGALASDTEITINKLSTSEIEERYPDIADLVDFVYELSPDGLQFSTSVSVELLLPDGADRNFPRAMLLISNGEAEAVEDAVYSVETGILSGNITHFSEIILYPLSLKIDYTKIRTTPVGSSDILYYEINLDGVNTNTPFRGNLRDLNGFGLTLLPDSGTEDIIALFLVSNLRFENILDDINIPGQVDYTCISAGTDGVTTTVDFVDFTSENLTEEFILKEESVGSSVELKTTITCVDESINDPSSAVSISIGGSPEGVRKAGTPPYADGGTSQRFIVASADDVTIFENNGTVVNTFERESNKYGALYLQPSNPGNNTHYYAYGSTGGLACAEDGVPGAFCKLDFSFSSSPGSSNTTDAQCGRDANGLERCDNFCRVQAGRVACASETQAGDTFDDPIDVFLGIAGLLPTSPLPIISYAPLSPTSGIAVTNDGYVMHIDTQTDIATDISSTAGTDVRSVACEQLDTGFGCVVQSFSDKQTTPCSGTDATDFTCGSSITTGEAVTVGLAKADNGNMVVIAPSFSDGNIYAIEFTPTFGVALQAEFFKNDYIQLFIGQTNFDFLNPGHAEIDPNNDTISVSGNGSDNVIIIPIDEMASLLGNTSAMIHWFN